MEFLSTVLKTLQDGWVWLEQTLSGAPALAGIGMILAAVGGLILAVMGLVGLVRLGFAMRRGALAARVRRDDEVGARIVVVRGGKGRRRLISAFLGDAIEKHLKAFMFGGPFRVTFYPGNLEGDDSAALLMKRTEADLIIWAEQPRGMKAVARMLSRPSNTFDPPRQPITLTMPREKSAWTDSLARAMAYAAAKQYRPALGRPQDFRAERLQPVVETVLGILAGKPRADEALLADA